VNSTQDCFDAGDEVRFSITLAGSTGNADPTTLTWRYIDPLGAESTGGSWSTAGSTSITRSTVGTFYTDLTLPYELPGVWEYRWDATGTVQCSEEATFAVLDTRFATPSAPTTSPTTGPPPSTGANFALLSFATPTSTGQQTFGHALGSVPQGGWVWGTGAGSSNASDSDMAFVFGMVDSTGNQRTVGAYSADGGAVSVSNTAQSDSHLIYTPENGSSGIQLSASFVSWSATGFTLDFDTVTTAPHTYHMTLLGGGTNTKVESNYIATQLGASTAILTGSTSVGFQPDMAINLMAFNNPASTGQSWPNLQGGYEFAFMTAGQPTTAPGDNWVAVGGSTDPRWNASVHQRGVTCWSADGAGTAATRKLWNRTGWRGASAANAFWWIEDWSSDGFTYQSWQLGLASWQFHAFVSGVNRKLVEINTATSTGDVSTTGIGFQPEMLIVYGSNSTAAANQVSSDDDADFSLGMALSTASQLCSWTGQQDNVATMDASRDHDSGAVYKRMTANSSSPTLVAEARLKSLDADGFTLTWVDADNEARPLFVMAIAST
jgi:hypothetical protein